MNDMVMKLFITNLVCMSIFHSFRLFISVKNTELGSLPSDMSKRMPLSFKEVHDCETACFIFGPLNVPWLESVTT